MAGHRLGFASSRAALVVLSLAVTLTALGCATGSASRKTTKADRMCAQLRACRSYLAAVERRIQESWTSGDVAAGARVVVVMRIDANGNPLEVRTLRADTPEVGRTCRSAIAYAAPFGPLPASLAFISRNDITMELAYRGPAK